MKRKENELTLKPLLLHMRVAAPEGGGGITDFFFLGGERVGAADGCSSSEEEEDLPTFLWPLEGRRATLFLLSTRASSKKIKEALNGLIQDIWADSTTGHFKLSPKEDEGVLNLIQTTDGADHA